MSYSGFENEDKIIDALNGKEFNELNTNLQQLIKDSFSNYQTSRTKGKKCKII